MGVHHGSAVGVVRGGDDWRARKCRYLASPTPLVSEMSSERSLRGHKLCGVVYWPRHSGVPLRRDRTAAGARSRIELGGRLMVGQWPLKPLILVRVQTSQLCAGKPTPSNPSPLAELYVKIIMTMFKNPFLNAVYAALYIVGIVSVLSTFVDGKVEASILIPMTMLSLFVLSATVMGLLFVYTPAKMFLDNQREEALTFFLKTVGAFACFAVIFVLFLLLR